MYVSIYRQMKEEAGQIELKNTTIEAEDSKGKKKNAFHIVTPGRTYYIVADTLVEMEACKEDFLIILGINVLNFASRNAGRARSSFVRLARIGRHGYHILSLL